jgi:hypothetical protein
MQRLINGFDINKPPTNPSGDKSYPLKVNLSSFYTIWETVLLSD